MSRSSAVFAIAILMSSMSATTQATGLTMKDWMDVGFNTVFGTYSVCKCLEWAEHSFYREDASQYPPESVKPTAYRNERLFHQIQNEHIFSHMPAGSLQLILWCRRDLIASRGELCAWFPRCWLEATSLFSAQAKVKLQTDILAVRTCEKDVKFLCGLAIATSLGQGMNGMRRLEWIKPTAHKAVEAAQPKTINSSKE